jgi:hypothetical protein
MSYGDFLHFDCIIADDIVTQMAIYESAEPTKTGATNQRKDSVFGYKMMLSCIAFRRPKKKANGIVKNAMRQPLILKYSAC